MKFKPYPLRYVIAILALCNGVAVKAQQTTGTPGSPSSTITADGRYLPNPDPAFKGQINLDAQNSKTYWPPRLVPPKGAPNVLLIITDDQGYGITSTFGGVIPTPTMDSLAKHGLRYTQFHSTALCSPSRAALITGRNHHQVGFGVIAEQATGYPGYDAIIGADNATIGRIMKDNGYSTSWFGKNHNTPEYLYSMSGPFDQWPSGMGFDYFYGFMGGETDQWTPWLFRDHTQIFPWKDKPGYNLTTGMADDAISYMDQIHSVAPDKPFFLYYAPGGTHAPHQPTQEWIDKFKGKFDMGWNKMREMIFENQKRLGVIPAGTKLTDWPQGQAEFGGASLPLWENLSPTEKKLFAHQAEVFAAYVAYTDYEIGRVIQHVKDLGEMDNTIVIYISGDNGTSAEGSTIGTPFDLASIQGIDVPVADQMKFYDAWGSPATTPHMSVAWSWAFDAPFKWTKQVASHFGGTRQGMVISWPGHIKDTGAIRSQFHHLIDIVPTILEITGIQAPLVVDGIAQKPIDGVSMAYTFDQANANAPTHHTKQYFEMMGNRAIYSDGWVATTTPPAGPWLMGVGKMPDVLNGYNWELYHITEDFSEANDLATKMPDKLAQMKELFMVEAAKNQVFPLDNAVLPRLLAAKPSYTAGRTEFNYSGRITGIPNSDAPNILAKSYSINAELTVPKGGGDGMVVTDGGRFGGYALYISKGKPVYAYNLLGVAYFEWVSNAVLSEGKHTIHFDFAYDGPGFGKGGTGTLTVDGKVADTKKIPHTIPVLLTIDESFDIGSDTRTPINDQYKLPFEFNGQITKLTFNLKPQTPEAEKQLNDKAMESKSKLQ